MSEFTRFADWARFLKVEPITAFQVAAERLDHFGCEGLTVRDCSMEYLNTGDTYSETLILTDDSVNGVDLIVSSWGDWFEGIEQYLAEKDIVSCGYCGEFIDCDHTNDNAICEFCGNNIR